MAEIRDRNDWEFRRILHAAKYRQFNFSIKTSAETWNEENRLKVSVVSVEPVLDNLQKHVERLKAEIETLKIWVYIVNKKSDFEKENICISYNTPGIFMTFEWFDWFLENHRMQISQCTFPTQYSLISNNWKLKIPEESDRET